MDFRCRPGRRRLAIAVAAVVPFFLSACYTMVRHEASMDVAGDASHDGGRACADCHYTSEWLGYFDQPLIYGTAGYYAYDWWYDYYQRPWWFDDYWYDGGGTSPGESGARGTSSWTQRRLRRGEKPAAPSGASGPSLSTGGSSGVSAGSSGQSGSPADSKEKEGPHPSYGKKKRNPRR